MSRSVLLKFLTRLVTPLVRLFVKRGIKFGETNEALKVAFLQMAKEHLIENSEKITASKLSVITGLHRPDIKKLIDKKEDKPSPDYLQKIIWKWQQEKSYKDSNNELRSLNVVGADSEFANLVKTVSTALNPYTVLYELERSGQIKIENNRAIVKEDVYVPQDNESKLDYLVLDLNDLIQTVDHNVFESDKTPYHHITTEYDCIPHSKIEEVNKWLAKEGADLHKKIRNYLSDIDKADSNEPKVRVSFGSFSRVGFIKNNME
jgi:hypothetical protein